MGRGPYGDGSFMETDPLCTIGKMNCANSENELFVNRGSKSPLCSKIEPLKNVQFGNKRHLAYRCRFYVVPPCLGLLHASPYPTFSNRNSGISFAKFLRLFLH